MRGVHHLNGESVLNLFILDYAVHTVVARLAVQGGAPAVLRQGGDGLIALHVSYRLDVIVVIISEKEKVHRTRSLAADNSRQQA